LQDKQSERSMSESDQMMFARISMRFSTNFEGRMLNPDAAADETSKSEPTIRLPSVPAKHLGKFNKNNKPDDPRPKKKKQKLNHDEDEVEDEDEDDVIKKAEIKFECLIAKCRMQFTTKKHLKLHEESHADEIYHECDECHKKYTSKQVLAIHKRSHTNERSFLCKFEGCNKSFTSWALLDQHKHTHNSKLDCFLCWLISLTLSLRFSRSTIRMFILQSKIQRKIWIEGSHSKVSSIV